MAFRADNGGFRCIAGNRALADGRSTEDCCQPDGEVPVVLQQRTSQRRVDLEPVAQTLGEILNAFVAGSPAGASRPAREGSPPPHRDSGNFLSCLIVVPGHRAAGQRLSLDHGQQPASELPVAGPGRTVTGHGQSLSGRAYRASAGGSPARLRGERTAVRSAGDYPGKALAARAELDVRHACRGRLGTYLLPLRVRCAGACIPGWRMRRLAGRYPPGLFPEGFAVRRLPRHPRACIPEQTPPRCPRTGACWRRQRRRS